MRNEFIGAIAIAFFVMVPSALAEDQVVLSSGVTLRGLILDHRSDDFAIKLRTELGEVPILRSAIHAVEQDADLESRYQLAARYFAISTAGKLELARWCLTNGLKRECELHIEEVLADKPADAEATKLLASLRNEQEAASDEGLTRNTRPKLDGKAGPGGRDKPRSTKANAAQIAAQTRAMLQKREAEWKKTALRIVNALGSNNPDVVSKAEDELAKINDPGAIMPLVEAMAKSSEQSRIKVLEAISRMPYSDGSSGLAAVAVVDPSPSMRAFAIECLRWRASHGWVYRSVFERALRSGIREQIANAADGTAELNEQKLIPALIDSLVCSVKIGERWQAETNYRNSYAPLPGGGYVHTESGRIRLVPVTAETENEPVLTALKRMTGQNFGYDKTGWQKWWTTYGTRSAVSEETKVKNAPDSAPSVSGEPRRNGPERGSRPPDVGQKNGPNDE